MNERFDSTTLTSAELPVRFGRYELVGILGSGGVGRVFDARLLGPSGFQKAVALKVLRTEVSARSVAASVDLAEEARVGALLSHPNIVDVFELEMTAGQVCVAMQRVE
ncbi:MAG: protein kinase, partial [Myxococcota bacterium]